MVKFVGFLNSCFLDMDKEYEYVVLIDVNGEHYGKAAFTSSRLTMDYGRHITSVSPLDKITARLGKIQSGLSDIVRFEDGMAKKD